MALALSSCGGGEGDPGNGEPLPPPTSGVQQRVFLTNDLPNNGAVEILDGETDRHSGFRVNVSRLPLRLAVSADKALTAVFEAGGNTLTLIDNASEQAVRSLNLGEWTESFAFLPDNETIYAAVRNTGRVVVWNTRTGDVNSILIPLARRLAISHDGQKALVFSDDSDEVTVVTTADRSTVTVAAPEFDRPIWAAFSSDDSKAFVLSCGAQCGGTQARVTELIMASNTAGASVAVTAGTVGLLHLEKLYVAGSTASGGVLEVVDTASMAPPATSVAIGDGFHHIIRRAQNNRLFIGALACNNVSTGCLSIFDPATGSATIGPAKGEVTGMTAITGRNVMYVAEGGELRIYDATSNAEQDTQIDIIGRAVDVKEID